MRKILGILVLVLLVVAPVSAGVNIFHSDFESATGKTLDTLEVDSVFFQVKNPLIDSVILYYMQYASTDNPSVRCTLYSTVDDISARAGSTVKKLALRAEWTVIAEVFSAYTTESTMKYNGITQDNLMGKAGAWYMVTYTASATAAHDETSKIKRAGIIQFPRPD